MNLIVKYNGADLGDPISQLVKRQLNTKKGLAGADEIFFNLFSYLESEESLQQMVIIDKQG